MKRSGIKISAVGPNQRMNLTIQRHLFKNVQVVQRAKKLAHENGAEIDLPAYAIVKSNIQRIGRNNSERRHFANSVRHHPNKTEKAPAFMAESKTNT